MNVAGFMKKVISFLWGLPVNNPHSKNNKCDYDKTENKRKKKTG